MRDYHVEKNQFYRKLGQIISNEVFNDAPVEINLCGDDWKVLKNIPFKPIMPDLPVVVLTRQSIGGGGLVVQYKNKSDKFLPLVIVVSNKTTNATKRFTVNVPPHSFQEHGWAEGWNYLSGDQIEISNDEFESKTIIIK